MTTTLPARASRSGTALPRWVSGVLPVVLLGLWELAGRVGGSVYLPPLSKVLGRFANTALPDPVERVGRAPLRKLSRNERIISPAAELAEHGLGYQGLLASFSAALAFTPEGDDEVDRLQEILRSQDADAATAEITGLEPSHPLFAAVRDAVAARQSTL